MARRDLYNQSGCLDLTAFYALQNIQREERAARRQKSSKKSTAHVHSVRVLRWSPET